MSRRPRRARLRAPSEEGARGALIASISTIVFVTIAIVLILRSPNWPAVQRQFFNRDHFHAAWPKVWKGFLVDLRLFGITLITVPILSIALAVARSFRGPAFFPIRALAVVFIDLMRGIPMILLILLLGFGVPALDLRGIPSGVFFWGVIALTLSYSAYTAEIIRSGIDAVPDSQRASARAIGLTQWQAMRHAILPQAFRNVIPALMNTVLSLQKDVALISVLGIREAVREAQIYTSRMFNYTSYVVATVLFLLLSIPLVRLVDWLTKRDRERRTQVAV